MAKLIHTSDLHLGAPLGWLGEQASVQREQLKSTLSSIVELAATERADCLVIAGDLFDSQSPPASEVRHVLQEFERLRAASGTTVVILPGSHDYLGPASVYSSHRKEFGRHGHVTILGLDGRPSADLPGAGLSVRGVPPRRNRSSAHQLAGLVPDPAYRHSVAVAHGSLLSAPVASDDHPIGPEELRGWSYVALGHWHSWRDVSIGGSKALYPGAPEVVAVDQVGAGYVAVVELGDEETSVRKQRVGKRAVRDLEIDVTGMDGVLRIAERARADVPPDPNTILRLALSGLVSVESGLDLEHLCETLAPDYFHVTPGSRDYHIRLDDAELQGFPERLVVGRFARLMRDKYESADAESERQEIEDALQLGVALLQGKDVLG